MVKATFPLVIPYLKAPSVVLHSYAAACVEKILIMKDPASNGGSAPLLKQPDLAPHTEDLLKNLFGAFDFPGSIENEYVMKAVMRSFSGLQEAVIPYLAHLLPPLTNKFNISPMGMIHIYKSIPYSAPFNKILFPITYI